MTLYLGHCEQGSIPLRAAESGIQLRTRSGMQWERSSDGTTWGSSFEAIGAPSVYASEVSGPAHCVQMFLCASSFPDLYEQGEAAGT